MVEIKAGAELDRAVAEAVGLRVMAKVLYGPDLFVDPRDGTTGALVEFHPSTDLNAAFAAAEKAASDFYGCVELPPCITLDNRTGWKCTIEESPEGRGSTPALAICAAILELAKVKQS